MSVTVKSILCGLMLSLLIANAQSYIEVADISFTITAKSEKKLHYGFAKGDEVYIDLNEIKELNISKLLVNEWPKTTILEKDNFNEITQKKVRISNEGIYEFIISNNDTNNINCDFRLYRVAQNDKNTDFNTAVYWKKTLDTNYYLQTEQIVFKTDTIVTELTEKIIKVHSTCNFNGNKTDFNIEIPDKCTVWSYYVGVEQEGFNAYKKAVSQLLDQAAKVANKTTDYGPLVALALNGVSFLTQLESGEDIDYYILDQENTNLWKNKAAFKYLKKGKVVNDYSKMDIIKKNRLNFCFSNDNLLLGVNVFVKVIAVQLIPHYKTIQSTKFNVSEKAIPYLKN